MEDFLRISLKICQQTTSTDREKIQETENLCTSNKNPVGILWGKVRVNRGFPLPPLPHIICGGLFLGTVAWQPHFDDKTRGGDRSELRNSRAQSHSKTRRLLPQQVLILHHSISFSDWPEPGWLLPDFVLI